MSDAQEAAETIWNGVRRLCIAVDLERYSQRNDPGQIEAQRAMSELLREAGTHGALERAQWHIQRQGDGELALLPPGINEAVVITSLTRSLRDGLHRYNRNVNDAARLRMRVAVHEGMTYVTEAGFAGDAINVVCRLRDAAESRRALRATKKDLVLIVSARIYQDVVCGHDAYDLPPASFRETEIVMPDKGFRAIAYIHTGDEPAEAGGEPADVTGEQPPSRPGQGDRGEGSRRAESTPGAPAPAGGGPVFNFRDHTNVGNVAAGDVNNYGPPPK